MISSDDYWKLSGDSLWGFHSWSIGLASESFVCVAMNSVYHNVVTFWNWCSAEMAQQWSVSICVRQCDEVMMPKMHHPLPESGLKMVLVHPTDLSRCVVAVWRFLMMFFWFLSLIQCCLFVRIFKCRGKLCLTWTQCRYTTIKWWRQLGPCSWCSFRWKDSSFKTGLMWVLSLWHEPLIAWLASS